MAYNDAFADFEMEKRLSIINAWEEKEKSKAENKAQQNLSFITAWETKKRAALEAKLNKIEEQPEKKKAGYAETLKNKVALVHKDAQEKRATVEAVRRQELLFAEEKAAKYRVKGQTRKKCMGCF